MTTTNNGAAEEHDWQAESKFWQLKYFELLSHSNQIIAALSRPLLQDVVAQQFAAQLAAQQAQQVKQAQPKQAAADVPQAG